LLAALINLTVMQTYAVAAPTVITGQTIDTSTGQSPGVSVNAGDVVEVTHSSITTRGHASAALKSEGTLTGNSLTLRTTGSTASAVEASNDGRIDLVQAQIIAEGSSAIGVSATDRARISLNNGSVSTSKTMGYGVFSDTSSRVELGNVTVSTAGGSAIGMGVFDNAGVVLTHSAVETSGIEAHALMLMGTSAAMPATANIVDSRVTTRGDFSVGINVNSDATVQVSGSQISTSGEDAHGVWLASVDATANLDDVSIRTEGDGAVGVSSQDGTATLRKVTITTLGEQAHGLYSQGDTARIDATGISISLDDAGVGAFAVSGGMVTLNTGTVNTRNGGVGLMAAIESRIAATDMDVTAQGDGAAAALMNRGATLTLENVRASAAGADSIALGAVGTADDQLNQATVEGGRLTAGQGSAIAVIGGKLDVTLSNTTVTGQRLLDINENVVNGASVAHGAVRVLAQNSVLTGDVQVAGASTGDSELNLDNSTLTGAVQHLDRLDVLDTSRWNVTGDSTLVDLHNSGTVAFQPGTTFKTLTVEGDLTGSGIFALNTDLAAERGDLLTVLGAVHDDQTLLIADSGREPGAANGELLVVDGNGGAGRFALAGRPYVDAGAFRYTLEQEGDDWLLRNTSINAVDSISDGSNAALGNQVAAAVLWGAEMNALVKRLGELRMGDDRGGVWTRGIAKRFNVENGHSRAFTQQVRGLEVGADQAIDLPEAKLYLGAMVGAATSSQQFGAGANGEINSRLLGVYATWMDARGYYLDSVAKYNWMENEVKTQANTGSRIKGSYRASGYAADIEFGRQISLQHNWFIEPQVELTYTHIGAERYTASNGLKVAPGDASSLQGRVGALLGRTLTQPNGLAFQPYVKASYVHEFAGESSVEVNGYTLDNKVADARVEVGFGGVLQVSQATKISLDVEHAQGRQVDQPWAVNLGARYLL